MRAMPYEGGKMRLRELLISGLFVTDISAQILTPPVVFAVASVKPNVQQDAGGTMWRETTERVRYGRATIQRLIARAFDVRVNYVVGPSWLRTETYDIEGVIPS